MPVRSASVELTSGRVRGDAGAFLGIPYATAPRWAPPQPVAWAGELEALRFGPPPPQPRRPISDFAWGPIPAGFEDCLSVNVWRPAGEGAWPVLVWVHGGGWTVGWSGSGLDAGTRLAEAAQAVVVTFNYRLGSLGYAFGNWGMLDQLALLEWVQREIAAFGGDPSEVTLAGQSAGAASVAGLLCSPRSDGLFARVVMHSPPLPEAANDPAPRARWDREFSHSMSAEEVVARHEALLRADGEWAGTRGAAMPTRDDVLPPIAPVARLDVPVLCGTTRDEATFLLRTGGRDAPDEQVARLSAHLFHAPLERWAAERSAAGGRVHVFRVDHASPDPRLGALHTIDVPLLFGTYDTEVGRHYVADDEATREVSAEMQREWARFLRGEDLGWAFRVLG